MTVIINSTNSALSSLRSSHLGSPVPTTAMPEEEEEESCANSHVSLDTDFFRMTAD